jgi:hypothetical protein
MLTTLIDLCGRPSTIPPILSRTLLVEHVLAVGDTEFQKKVTTKFLGTKARQPSSRVRHNLGTSKNLVVMAGL